VKARRSCDDVDNELKVLKFLKRVQNWLKTKKNELEETAETSLSGS